jgi:peroxiredoxin (alkyl hydroperoxide reductase subunit C)
MSQKAQLNKPAPDFTLSDFDGQEFTLSSFKDKKNVVLVFNRGFL